MSEFTKYPLSRRNFIKTASAAGLATLASPALSLRTARANSPVELILGAWPAPKSTAVINLVERFNASHPGVLAQVIEDGARYDKLVASFAIDRSQPYAHFIQHNAQRFADGAAQGLWQKIDPAKVSNYARLDSRFQRPDGLGAFWIADIEGIVYNKRLVKTPPTSWYDLFDPAYRGKTSFWQPPSFSVNGVPIFARLQGQDEGNLESAIGLYADAAKAGQFTAFHSSAAQLRQQLQTDQIAITPGFQGIVQPWIEDGDEIGFVIPKEGPVIFPEGWQIVSGLEGEELDFAYALFNEIISPEVVSEYATLNPVIPLVEGAQLPEKYRDEPTFQLSALENAISFDWGKLSDAVPAATDLWNSTVAPHL